MTVEFVYIEGKIQAREIEDQPLKAGQVRVRPQFSAAKHGTEAAFTRGHGAKRGNYNRDLHLFEAAAASEPKPLPIGNMMVGTVVETGPEVTTLRTGDRVSAWAGFRSMHVLHQNDCMKLTADASWQAAVCNDPLQFALGAVRDGQVRLGDAVAVFGLGAIGLMAIQCARLSGAQTIIGLDPARNRRGAAEAVGATAVLDPTACDAGLEIKRLTRNRGTDVCIEFSGIRSALQQALRGVAFGGRIVYGAFPNPFDAGLDFGAESHMNIPQIVFSRACSQPDRDHPRWDFPRICATSQAMLSAGKFDCAPIVTPVIPFDRIVDDYIAITRDASAGIKLGVAH